MAENPEGVLESVKEKIEEKIHAHDSSSSSSDSEREVEKKPAVVPSAPPEPKVFRLFGRERPVHAVVGGGKTADVLLWRNKKVSGSVLVTATAIWVLFELVEYHLLTLVCHMLILSIALLFLWSNAHTFINKSPPRIPEVHLPEEPFLMVASQLTSEINRGFALLRGIASGKELKKFLMVIAGLWILSIVGSCCNFLTLFYIVFILLHTVPVLYEKYDHKIDPLAEKAVIELNKHYAVFNDKVLTKIPVASLKAKRV